MLKLENKTLEKGKEGRIFLFIFVQFDLFSVIFDILITVTHLHGVHLEQSTGFRLFPSPVSDHCVQVTNKVLCLLAFDSKTSAWDHSFNCVQYTYMVY